MGDVTLSDARDRLEALVASVESGGSVTITRDGKPVARLVQPLPSRLASPDRVAEIVEGFRVLREGIAARGERFSWSELKASRDDGRP